MDPILRTIHFETTPDGGVAPTPAEPVAATEPPPDAEPPEEQSESVAPAWSPEDPTFRDAVAREAEAIVEGRLSQLLANAEQAGFGSPTMHTPTAEAIIGDLDPFADDFGAQLDARFQSLEQRILGTLERVAQPLALREEQEAIQRGNERLADIVADDIARHGDFATAEDGSQPGRAAVEQIAPMFFQQAQERYGFGPRAAEAAVRQAAQVIRQIEAAAAAAAVAKERNHNAALAGAIGEPGGAGAALAQPSSTIAAVQGVPSLAAKYGRTP